MSARSKTGGGIGTNQYAIKGASTVTDPTGAARAAALDDTPHERHGELDDADVTADNLADAPVVQGRVARCAYGCGATRPSSQSLAFFKDRSSGVDQCECGFSSIAHQTPFTPKGWTPGLNACMAGPGFRQVATPETDEFYCGCKGWD